MTHTPAVDSLEHIGTLRKLADRARLELELAPPLPDPRWLRFACAELAAIEHAIAALTRPPGGSERLRHLGYIKADTALDLGKYDGVGTVIYKSPDRLDGAEPVAIYALASPQGAEQRQEVVPYGWLEPETGNFVDHATKLAMPFDASTYTLAIFTAPVRHSCETDMLSDCPGCNAEHDATPHPAQAASQGDAVEWPREAKPAADGDGWIALTRHCEHRMDEMQAKVWNSCRAACIAAASPTGVQAAQVSDLSEALLLMTRAAYPVSNEIDPRGYRWSIAYLDEALPIARAALKSLAQPGSAAHGGEDAK